MARYFCGFDGCRERPEDLCCISCPDLALCKGRCDERDYMACDSIEPEKEEGEKQDGKKTF